MKTTIASMLTLYLVASVSMAQTHLDVKVPGSIEHDQIGRVKRIVETEKKETMFGAHKKSTSMDERTYDANGNQLIREVSDGMGQVTRTVEIKRLPSNKECKFSNYDGRHKPTSTATIDWNRDGTQRGNNHH